MLTCYILLYFRQSNVLGVLMW